MEKYFNKTNHARYGTYYVQQLHHLKTVYPGMKPLLEGKGLSVQAQNFPFVQASTDQRGEQTINWDAKLQVGHMVLQCTSSL